MFLVVSVFKDKFDQISSKDDYCPVVIVHLFGTIAEIIILGRTELFPNPNQLNLKSWNGPIYLYVLKEILDVYRSLDGSIFVCFLDTSKAFDRVNLIYSLLP